MSASTQPREYKCPVCKKLLVIGTFVGWVEVHCPRCKKRRRLDA